MTETTAPSDTPEPPNRCRLIIVVDAATSKSLSDDDFATLMGAGDVASILFFNGSGEDENAWQDAVQRQVIMAQSMGIAALVDGDTRVAGRVGADGVQLGQDPQALEDALDKFTPRMMIGAGNVKTRHNALVLGELQPDYVMFGKPGTDTRPEPHPKNVDMGQWWAAMVEIPGVVLGGTSLDSVADIARTGVDFIAMGNAIFAPQESGRASAQEAAEAVKQINALLDTHAPRFDADES